MMDIINKVVNEKLVKVIMSNGTYKEFHKVVMRPIMIKNKHMYQFEMFTKTQAFHQNVDDKQAKELVLEIMESMKQMDAFMVDEVKTIKRTKKGKIMEHSHKQINKKAEVTHNRQKQYILQEGIVIPAFVDLGIMNQDGMIIKAKYDKFKQINRFIEMVDDVLQGENRKHLNIIDFGCGKSYLTFILYYYLVEIRKMSVNIVGLDLKKEVIKNCNAIKDRYGYENLSFELGDIHGYQPNFEVDMVISLHACDVATDFALANAIQWKSKYILSVPCCQKEVNRTIKEEYNPILNYGLLKERYSALVTDTIRSQVLEACGYQVQVMEFVDMMHSPKNILLRCRLQEAKQVQLSNEFKGWLASMHLQPTLLKELARMGLYEEL